MAPLPANAIGEDGESEVAKNPEPNLRICQQLGNTQLDCRKIRSVR